MKTAYQTNGISIDINLMQKSVSKDKLILLPILLILLAVGASMTIGWYWYEAQSKLSAIKLQLTQVTHAADQLETRLTQNPANGQLIDFINQPKLLRQSKPVTTQLLTQLNKLLPTYANVTQLDLNEQNAVNLTLYFAKTEDIISFSQSIQSSVNFKLVQMGTINNINNLPEDQTKTIVPVPVSGSSLILPVYQTTFELKYIKDDIEDKGN